MTEPWQVLMLTLLVAVIFAGWAKIIGEVLTCPPNRTRDSKSRPVPRGKDFPG